MKETEDKPSLTLDTMPICTPGPDGSCAVCADEGIPGQVLALRPFDMALVSTAAGEQEVALDLVDNVQVGDRILVHVGVAIAKLEE